MHTFENLEKIWKMQVATLIAVLVSYYCYFFNVVYNGIYK